MLQFQTEKGRHLANNSDSGETTDWEIFRWLNEQDIDTKFSVQVCNRKKCWLKDIQCWQLRQKQCLTHRWRMHRWTGLNDGIRGIQIYTFSFYFLLSFSLSSFLPPSSSLLSFLLSSLFPSLFPSLLSFSLFSFHFELQRNKYIQSILDKWSGLKQKNLYIKNQEEIETVMNSTLWTEHGEEWFKGPWFQTEECNR